MARRLVTRTADDFEAEQAQPAEPAERTEVELRGALRSMATQLNTAFVARDEAVECIQLALLCGFNYLLVGDPGTAKTALAECASKHVTGARYFSPAALGSYTTLGDLVGERDIPALMGGVSQRSTRGKLAAVELAFLDELFKAADATCNTLLSAFNAGERRFDGASIPLWTAGAATNWPEVLTQKPIVAAFWDRLHFRCVVSTVTGEAALTAMLRTGRSFSTAKYQPAPDARVSFDELLAAHRHINQVALGSDIEKMLVSFHTRLGASEVHLSGRRLVELQRVLQASAWLAGRTTVSIRDMRHLKWCAWNKRDDIAKVQAVLDTIDAEYARTLTVSVDTVRKLHANYQRNGWSPATANDFLGKAEAVVAEIKAAIDGGNLTAQSRSDVIRAATLLRNEVADVLSKYGVQLECK